MKDLKKTTRLLFRVMTTLTAVAMLWLPATAQADSTGTDPEPATTTVLPLLGSNLTVQIVIDSEGIVTSVSVDNNFVAFEQKDDEISFLYSTVDGQATITIEFEDDDSDEADEADEADFDDLDDLDEADFDDLDEADFDDLDEADFDDLDEADFDDLDEADFDDLDEADFDDLDEADHDEADYDEALSNQWSDQ